MDDAMMRTGELYKIPYHVDKLLDDLYRKFDKNHKGITDATYSDTHLLTFDICFSSSIQNY